MNTNIYLFLKQFNLLSENKEYNRILVENFSNNLLNKPTFINESETNISKTLGHLFKSKNAFKKIKQKIDANSFLSLDDGHSKFSHPGFSLLAGINCPFADLCLTWVEEVKVAINADEPEKTIRELHKKYSDNPDAINCFAAIGQHRLPDLFNKLKRNGDLFKPIRTNTSEMRNLILKSINHYEMIKNTKIELFRIHNSGDFFNQYYFDAWIEVAQLRPDILFYAYTKSLPYWVEWIERGFRTGEKIPANFKLIASYGGMKDDYIEKYQLRNAKVVNTPAEAEALGLQIDITDELAYNSDANFALLLHGRQEGEKYNIANRNGLFMHSIPFVFNLPISKREKEMIVGQMEKWRNEHYGVFADNHGSSFKYFKRDRERLINSAIKHLKIKHPEISISEKDELTINESKNIILENYKPYTFAYSCVGTSGSKLEELEYIIDNMKEVSKTEFFKNVSYEEELSSFNYNSESEMKKDWHIRYYKIKKNDIDAYIMVHSAIEYVFKK